MHSHVRATGLSESRLDMTPMIDCVFLLLIFFLVTLKFSDLLAHLDVNRPQRPPDTIIQTVGDLRIQVGAEGLTLNGRPCSLEVLGRQLGALAQSDKSQTVEIFCTSDSRHGTLVSVLDECARAGLTNLALLSL